MEKKKAPQNVLDANVSIETIGFYVFRHKNHAHIFGLCVILPYLCPRKLKIIRK